MDKNSDSKKRFAIRGVKLLHFGLVIILFYAFWLIFRYHTLKPGGGVGFRYNYYIMIGYAVLVFFFNRTYNALLYGYSRIRSLVFSNFLSQLFSVCIIWLVVSIAWRKFHSPAIFLLLLFLQLTVDVFLSYYGNWLFFKYNPPRKTILIYRSELDKKRFGTIKGKPTERLYHITEEFQYDGYSFQAIREKLTDYEAVFVAGVHSRCRNGIAKYCKDKGVPGFFLPHIGDVIMQEARHIQSFDSPVLFLERKTLNPEYAIIKRGFDIFATGLALVILSPVLLITAIAIHFYDGGPAIYKQVRLTEGGRKFEIYKFRSMRVDAEKDGIARLSTGENDPRITPIGRFVRKCRLDELPQLWNIFKGDMSLVGPRPERPEIAEKYYEFLPDFNLRLQVKAGLTGYAQVYGKYNTDPYEKLEFDLLYINNMSFLTDIKLIFATFGILFKKESTEGVSVNQITAIDYENESVRSDDPPSGVPKDKPDYWAD